MNPPTRSDGRLGGLVRRTESAVRFARRALAPSLCALLLALGAGAATHAAEAPEVGDNPALEHHMMTLAAELRCLQCQNQTLADSNAPLAVDLRQQIRELLAKGETDEQVKTYLVARYGDFVLYRPPVKTQTMFLWFGPGLILLAGLAALFFALKRRNERLAAEVPAAVSVEQERRAQKILADDPDNEGNLS